MANKIPFTTAVLICINTIIGAGLFINLTTLTAKSGSLGFATYLLAAILLIPFIICLAELGSMHPVTGGLYTYATTYINKQFGFLSGWSYFLSKATSAALLTHVLSLYLQFSIPQLEQIPTLFVSYIIISFIALLNIGGILLDGKIQYLFSGLKAAPLIFAFIAGIILYNPNHITATSSSVKSLFSAIPTALFAIVGFEIASSIAGLLAKPKKTFPRVVFAAFAIVVTSVTLLQFLVFGALGPELETIPTPIMELGDNLGEIGSFLGKCANGFFFSSVAGNITSILGSNSWNLHSLAQHNHLPWKSIVTYINKDHIPITCIGLHALLSISIITVTGDIIALQNMAVFALFISYSLTAYAAYKASKSSSNNISPKTSALASIICTVITFLCLINIYSFGVSFSFLSIFLLGCSLSIIKYYSSAIKTIKPGYLVMSKKTISLTTAVLICLNTMIGAGAFVNLRQLSIAVNKWGFASYIIAAIIALPLVLCASELGRRLPMSGGLYVYSKTYINKYWGFVSGWGYFVGKTTSATLLCHFLMLYLQKTIPLLNTVPILLLDYVMIGLVLFASALGALSKKSIQITVTILKIVPFICAFILGFASFDMHNFVGNPTTLPAFFMAIPSALYAVVGFEVICSIGGLIENPEKNIQRSILIAFSIVIAFNMLLQGLVYGALGPKIAAIAEPLTNLAGLISPKMLVLGRVINGMFMTSVFGSTIAMIASNSWNLSTLAANDHFPGKKFLTLTNSYEVPYISLLVTGSIACLILSITSKFVPLQNMTIFSLFISFGLTAYSTLQATKDEGRYLYKLLAYAAIALCLSILLVCLTNIYKFGLSASFLSIFLSGCFLALYKSRAKQSK